MNKHLNQEKGYREEIVEKLFFTGKLYRITIFYLFSSKSRVIQSFSLLIHNIGAKVKEKNSNANKILKISPIIHLQKGYD